MLDPGESFEIIDGNIVLKEKIYESVEGETHYSRYHVVADIHQFFDVARFPLNEFILTMEKPWQPWPEDRLQMIFLTIIMETL